MQRPSSSLFSFMMAELMFLAVGGADWKECANQCGRGFLVGDLAATTRKNTCSEKCRQALSRKKRAGEGTGPISCEPE
jgi:hypothetical protein